MSLAFSIIRCAPRKRRSRLPRTVMLLALFFSLTALCGWLLFNLFKHTV